jgi:hypothetical protein
VNGAPIADQAVIAGGRTRQGGRIAQRVVRTDAEGQARIRLTAAGKWYVKFIHMVPGTETGLDYVSSWATLTFQIR